ncbi:MAG: hotdog fold thioesterase [Desulfobacterales bacterium]|nr:hotdog fold thioesterase [Desulfobacterales bacterium]
MTSESRLDAIRNYISKDAFADFLGAKVEIPEPGFSRVTLTVTPDMVNFHGITHGGLIFTLGDMAFAAAGNSHGQAAVALNVNISFLKASGVGDRLVAEAREVSVGGRTALYEIKVFNDSTGDLLASSQDLVYRKKEWFVPPKEQD